MRFESWDGQGLEQTAFIALCDSVESPNYHM